MGPTTHIDATRYYIRGIFTFYKKCTITVSITIIGVIFYYYYYHYCNYYYVYHILLLILL